MKNKNIYFIAVLLLILNTQNSIAQTIFEWETATDNGDNVTETLDGITATFSGLPDITFIDCDGCLGSTNNIVVSEQTYDGMSVTFTFSEPVIVNSILAIDGNIVISDIDYTFTPTGGNNSMIIASLTNGSASVDLNWTEVTSFTVTSVGSLFGFDDLYINDSSLSSSDYNSKKIILYPNPVRDILNLKNADNLESIIVFNSLGQIILETKNNIINFENFDSGIYHLKIKTNNGLETVSVVKE